VIFVVKDQ